MRLRLVPVEGWKKVGKAFTWPFEKDEIQRILSTVERRKLLFTLARQNDHIALSKAIKGDVRDVHKRVNEIGEGVAQSQLSEKHHKIRLWLSGLDPSSNYNRALRKRLQGTGSWLIKNDVFRDWEQDPGPGSIIWLYGIPGCGKTILSSTILEHVLDSYPPTSNTAVLYFFFDFNDVNKQQHEAMIRSLLSQLSMHCVSVPPVLDTLYSSCMNGGRKPTFEALLETFHQMAIIFKTTFIILDALDECEERPELMADIEQLVGWKDTNLRILATSRREKDIEDSILPLTKDESRICMQSALVNADIRAYVHDQIRTNTKLHRVVELILDKDVVVEVQSERFIAEHWQRLREDANQKWSRYCSTRVPSSTLKRWKPQEMEKEQMFCRCYLSMEVTQACRIDRVELAAIMHLLKMMSQNLNCSSSLSQI